MNILDITPKKAIFRQAGTPIEPELRPIWRVALLTIILSSLCTGNKANGKKIQVLCSLISSSNKRINYFSVSTDIFNSFSIRFDPLIDKAIDLGIGEKLFELDSSKSIKLTTKGKSFANRIISDQEIFTTEKKFIGNFKKTFFTDEVIEKIMSGDRL